jgi:hypothetical protein
MFLIGPDGFTFILIGGVGKKKKSKLTKTWMM